MTLILLLMTLISAPALTAPPQTARTPIWIDHKGTDQVGVRVVYELKEALRASRAYALGSSAATAPLTLWIVSVDNSCGSTDRKATAAAIVLARHETLVTAWVQTVSGGKTQNAAADILAGVDHALSK
jgi:hypothetical protein